MKCRSGVSVQGEVFVEGLFVPGKSLLIGSSGAVGGKNETFRVADFRRHEKFNIATVYFDVCLLKLSQPVPFTSRSFPICLGTVLKIFSEKGPSQKKKTKKR